MSLQGSWAPPWRPFCITTDIVLQATQGSSCGPALDFSCQAPAVGAETCLCPDTGHSTNRNAKASSKTWPISPCPFSFYLLKRTTWQGARSAGDNVCPLKGRSLWTIGLTLPASLPTDPPAAQRVSSGQRGCITTLPSLQC